MSSSTTVPPSPPAPTTTQAVDTATTDVRKAAENEAKSTINTIWQKIENAAEWPVEKIEALIADLKKHL